MRRCLLPYLVKMLHHPSEHVRGYAARHLSELCTHTGKVVQAVVLRDAGGRLDSLLSQLANSSDILDKASHADLIGHCLLHCDTDMAEAVNDAGTVQLVYELFQQASTDGTKCRIMHCLMVGDTGNSCTSAEHHSILPYKISLTIYVSNW